MILYRAICHPDDVRAISLGKHWSTEIKSAYPYGNKTQLKYYYVYKCNVSEAYINKQETLSANLEYPWEKEVVLNQGSQIEIIGIFKFNKPHRALLDDSEQNITYKATV